MQSKYLKYCCQQMSQQDGVLLLLISDLEFTEKGKHRHGRTYTQMKKIIPKLSRMTLSRLMARTLISRVNNRYFAEIPPKITNVTV